MFVTDYFCYLKEKNKKILVFKTKGPVIICCLKGGGEGWRTFGGF